MDYKEEDKIVIKMRFLKIASLFWVMLFLMGVSVFAASQYVNDMGKFFSDVTVKELTSRVERVKNATGKDIYVLTVDKLEGKTIDEAAVEYGKGHSVNGVVIYISKQPAKLTIKVGKNTAKLITEDKKALVRDAMVNAFKQKRFDDGILQAVGMLEGYMNSRIGGTTTYHPYGSNPETGVVTRKESKGTNWLLLLLILGGGFFIITMILRAITGSQGQPGQAGMPGAPGPGMPVGGGGGGFFSGLMGGLGGALLGNWLFNSFSGHNNNSMASGMGGDSWGGGASDPASGWQNDDAGSFSGGSDSADWGGGGDSGGGDFGGGGGDF